MLQLISSLLDIDPLLPAVGMALIIILLLLGDFIYHRGPGKKE